MDGARNITIVAFLLLAAYSIAYVEPDADSNRDLFPYKNPDDPIFLVVTGQSNAVQVIKSREPMARNELVWDWTKTWDNSAADGGRTRWHWRIPDPQGAYLSEILSGPIITGYPQGHRGGIAWGLADKLSRLTGRRVYMVTTAQSGAPITEWQPGQGAVGLELDMQVGNALHQLQEKYPGVQFADIVVWSQGEADAQIGTPAEEYAARWLEWRDHVEGWNNSQPWSDPRHTRWFVNQISRDVPHWVDWQGHDYLLATYGERITLMSAEKKETFDYIHFWGDEATEFGNEVADHIFAPPSAILPGC